MIARCWLPRGHHVHSVVTLSRGLNTNASNQKRFRLGQAVVLSSSSLLLAAAAALAYQNQVSRSETVQQQQCVVRHHDNHSKKMRTFTKEQVSKHVSEDTGGIYITHLDGVYDVTSFVKCHPGGNKILLAAGGSVDPFWSVYKQHAKQPVLDLLEEMRVGTLSDYTPEAAPPTAIAKAVNDPFAHEPQDRNSTLPVYSKQPFCAGTLPERIPLNYITPSELMYIRNNNAVPTPIALEDYRLRLGSQGKELTLNDLQTKFPSKELTVTLVCAGNRRAEMNEVEPVVGLKWKSDAVSTCTWKGVLLSDLKDLLAEDDGEPVNHVWFQGRDKPYDASVPAEKALSPQGEVLIAYEMNGKPIPRDHGGPVRVIVPGYVGARWVKWLDGIKTSYEESPSTWQRGPSYKSFGPSYKKLESINAEDFPSVQELPVQSAICTFTWNPATNLLTVSGWAWSGGGRKILRVEVSMDGGENWQEAQLGQGKDQPANKAWAWTFWECACSLSSSSQQSKEIELVVRCCDQSFNVQPETPKSIWNVRGILNNSYHHVRIANPK